jgi:hypothetical protein
VIFHSEPENWKELQVWVSEIFTDCGCESQIEKDIETVRGMVNVDVYIVDKFNTPNSIYLCECKYWSNAIPQTVVHAFRSVVSDNGAHHGFLISRKGFQSGAYKVSSSTNLSILSWDEFQEKFYERWIEAMTKRIHTNCNIMTEIITNDTDNIKNFSNSQYEYHVALSKRAMIISCKLFTIMPTIKESKPPIIMMKINDSSNDLIEFNSKRDCLNYINRGLLDIIGEYYDFLHSVQSARSP